MMCEVHKNKQCYPTEKVKTHHALNESPDLGLHCLAATLLLYVGWD